MNSFYRQHPVRNGYRSLALFLIVLTCFTSSLGSIEVDREELDKTSSNRIVFINYEGPYARVESNEDIWAIGYNLGLSIRNGAARAGTTSRYFAVHSFDPSLSDAMNADIFGLGVDAGVDHIRNLRLILQGYLQGAYEYSASDAVLLAEFITIYNAVYRGNWEYFTESYSEAVLSGLDEKKSGLSIRFDEWPGQAQILIPLSSASPASLGAIDTGAISDDQVVEQLRQEEDRAIDSRKDLVDLKEREADEEKQSAELQREAIEEEEQRIAAERKAIEAERERIEQEREEAAAELERSADDPAARAAAQEEREKKEAELAEAEQELEEREETLQEQESELEEQKEEARRTEERAEAKAEEAREDRAGIAEDQQDMIREQEAARLAPEGLLGISLNSPDAPIGRLVLVNPENGQILARSVLDTINARTLTLADDSIIAAAGTGPSGIRLVAMNTENLELDIQGSNEINENSLVWLQGNNVYAIENTEGTQYLSRFNRDLQRQARSTVPVHAHASVYFVDGTLLTQNRDGSVLLLRPGDLTESR